MLDNSVVGIITPKKYILNGLWFGPGITLRDSSRRGGAEKPKRVIIWVHGLGSSAFSMLHVVQRLGDAETAVLTFNNRGFGTINRIKKIGKKSKSLVAGSVHEVFTDSVDDIQGAINFVKKQGVKEIYLAGHSTGCQKSVYWAHKNKGGRDVKGIILVAPVSDHADALQPDKRRQVARLAKIAQLLIKKGKPHELLPQSPQNHPGALFFFDAQRFLSLYTPDSKETIFSYEQLKKDPRTLKSVRVPILMLWAEKDEFSDRPATRVVEWFRNNTLTKLETSVVPGVLHSFHGAEKEVAECIKEWILGKK